MTSITTNVLKNVLVTFLSVPQVYQFYLIQVNKINFVETSKKCGILYLLCKKIISDMQKHQISLSGVLIKVIES